MASSINRLARNAKRAQFRVVPSKTAVIPSRTAIARVGRPPDRGSSSLAIAGEETRHILLYRRTFSDLERLVGTNNSDDRDEFHHAMRLMFMLGLRTDDVTKILSYAPETIARWINGSRCPHREMRQYVLDRCLIILRDKVEAKPPREFIRLGEP